jgi:phosphate transport system substrate-binding protein
MCFRLLPVFSLLGALLIAACAPTPQVPRPAVTLRLAEAADQTVLLDRVAEAYEGDHAWVTIERQSLAASEAIEQIKRGQLDAAIVHDAVAPSEDVWISGLAHDPAAIIVHPSNPIEDVTPDQLSDLFQGRTFDWTPFGGTGEVIPVSRETEAYSRRLFEVRIMQNRAVTRNAVLKPSGKGVIDFVANTPGAIGYAPLSHIDGRVKAIKIDGAAPAPETAASGEYILAAPLYVITKAEPQGDLREFAAWLLGEPGQSLLSQSGLGRVR